MKTSPMKFEGVYKLEQFKNLNAENPEPSGNSKLDNVLGALQNRNDEMDRFHILNGLEQETGGFVYRVEQDSYWIVDDEQGLDYEAYVESEQAFEKECKVIDDNTPTEDIERDNEDFCNKIDALIHDKFIPVAIPLQVNYAKDPRTGSINKLKFNRLA